MDVVWLDVIEEALVVGNKEHATIWGAHGIHAFRDDLERIDIEAGVGLVHNAVFRVEHHHLEDLVAFFLTAGEAFVDCAGGKFSIHFQEIHFLVERFIVTDGVDVLAFREARLEGGADEVGIRDAGDFVRILKSEENSGAGTLVDRHFGDVLAIHSDFTCGR